MKQKLIKPLLLAIAVLFAAIPLQAQMVSSNNDDEVNKVDQYAQRYRPGQVIVKFKENSPVDLKFSKGKFQSSSVKELDKVMTTLGITEAEKLMPLTGDIKNRAPRKAKALSGREIVEPNLSKLYCLKFEENEERNVIQAVEMLKGLKEVEFAEPNYLAFIQSTEESITYQEEPYYSQQWGLNAINMPQLWEMPKTDETRPVIAILDTGVDITHPDLADNIWTNSNEATGADYEDDDNNGYVDDVHGWDFVAGTPIIGNGMDRNGHGTHCAGIAAAVGNNGIGITGANPDALILPIKVMGDDGSGDIATICRGIDYATAAGAHVLSMSFGGGASAAEYQALCKTLTSYAVLVGAAGNSGFSIYGLSNPVFPGAYDIVLGVMASSSDGQLAGFSNYDPDGPFFSKYNMDKAFSQEVTWSDEMMWNYDLMAPGVNITSTYLNGSYKALNGTSMATPMVAGAISRILQVKGYDYAHDYGLMGDMAMAKNGSYLDLTVFDAQKAASFDETNREVALALIALEIDDSDGDGDGRFDAGETISIWPTIRSLWGHAENIRISIEPYDDNTPTDAIEVLENNVDFGWSLNSRGSFKSKNPIRVHVNENAYDGMHLPYKIVITSDNLLAGVEQEHVFEVENGVELGGVLTENLTLYPNVHYIVNSNLSIPDGVTLTIKPGTKIIFRDGTGISVKGYSYSNFTGEYDELGNPVYDFVGGGRIIAEGTPDNPIIIDRSMCINIQTMASFNFSITGKFNYIYFINPPPIYCVDNQYYSKKLNFLNCVFDGFRSNGIACSVLRKCNIQNSFTDEPISIYTNPELYYCNYIHNNYEYYSCDINYETCKLSNIFKSNSPEYGDICFVYRNDEPIIQHSEYPCYFGSSNFNTVKSFMLDGNNNFGFGTIDLSNMLTRPVKEAHGIVWKVVVDGYDAQDEFDQLPPLGVGRHKFEVYYNRDDIDTTFTPSVSMGFREPYTQTPIDNDGFWCVKDSASVYTVFLDITGKTNCDGLNRIKVTGGKDHDHFDMPDEYSRFNVLVQAAGSMATGFAAEAGMGNVKLTWNNENNDFEDAMGFNVYRYNYIEVDSLDRWGNPTGVMITVPDTVRLNQMILDLDTDQFTDYEVTPGETYYYYYKVLSTDLKEYDISNVVAATPLTSTLGDANASGEVDVADVITTVNYAAGMEPRPFIFEAADVNVDTEIDILDVIGIIRIITNPNAAPSTASIESVAEYWVKDGVVWLETPVDLAGVQVSLDAPQGSSITPTEDLDGFEKVSTWLADNDYLFLAYNMAGRTISVGRHPILNIGANEIADIRLSDTYGHNVMATPSIVTAVENINADGKRAVPQGIYDLMGRKISTKASDLNRLPHGIYIVNGKKEVK